MWFFKSRPVSITVYGFVENLPKGYQKTEYRFNVSSNEEKCIDNKLCIGIVFPFSPNKQNGGFSLLKEDCLSKLEPELSEPIYINNDNIEVTDEFRKFKNNNYDLVNIQNLSQTYLDDFGIIKTWIEQNKWYHISYKHKISSDSKLFFPSTLPLVVENVDKPTMDYKLWVNNNIPYEKCQELTPLNYNVDMINVKPYKVNIPNWEFDVKLSTYNWDSSDDDSSSE